MYMYNYALLATTRSKDTQYWVTDYYSLCLVSLYGGGREQVLLFFLFVFWLIMDFFLFYSQERY
jgi:hypothetical protein